MANRIANSLYFDRDLAQSETLLDHVQDYTVAPALFDGAVMHDGAVQSPIVITMYPESDIGHFVPSFFNDWYNRIHFIPNQLDLGNLLSDQGREVIMWNAFLMSVEVESFTTINADGITVTQPSPAPYFAAPLSQSKYLLNIQTEGPANILAALVWSIEGVLYSVPITGRRTVVWPFPPNWRSPVDETLEWLTYIESSFDRTEQRFAGRAEPRRILEFNSQITGRNTQLFENIMYGWSDRLFALPLWHEKATLTSDAVIGSTVIALNTVNKTFVENGLIVLYSSPTSFEAMEIASVTSSDVTLKKGLDMAWPKGSRVFPAMVAKLENQNTSRRVAEDKLDLSVRFVGSPAETDPRIPAIAAAITYEGVEVFTEGTNWAAPMGVQFNSDYTTIDSDSGIFTLRQRSGWPEITKGHEWLLKTPSEATALRAFFGRRRGRLVPAWVPTGTVDFTLVEPALAGQTVLIVKNNDYGQLVNEHPARRHVLIQLRGGTNILRAIDSYTPSSNGNAELGLTVAPGVALTPAQVRRISFIGLYRGASDAVTFSWKTTDVAVVQTALTLTRPG